MLEFKSVDEIRQPTKTKEDINTNTILDKSNSIRTYLNILKTSKINDLKWRIPDDNYVQLVWSLNILNDQYTQKVNVIEAKLDQIQDKENEEYKALLETLNQYLESTKQQLNKLNIQWDDLDMEKIDNEIGMENAKASLYEKLSINQLTYENWWLKQFMKWIVDWLITDNIELYFKIKQDWFDFIIDVLKQIFSWDWICAIAEWMKVSITDLFSWDPYKTWKSAIELWLVWVGSWIWISLSKRAWKAAIKAAWESAIKAWWKNMKSTALNWVWNVLVAPSKWVDAIVDATKSVWRSVWEIHWKAVKTVSKNREDFKVTDFGKSLQAQGWYVSLQMIEDGFMLPKKSYEFSQTLIKRWIYEVKVRHADLYNRWADFLSEFSSKHSDTFIGKKLQSKWYTELFEKTADKDILKLNNSVNVDNLTYLSQLERWVELSAEQISRLKQEIIDKVEWMGIKDLDLKADTYTKYLLESLGYRDMYTLKHSLKTSMYAKIIGKANDYSPQQVKELERSMLLHDMGKIWTPNSVLHKNWKLNDDEFLHMKNHASWTNEILHDMPFIDKNNSSVLDWASQHHEKFNGTWYPNKLSWNEINEYARIANVADSFDAMSSYREYNIVKSFKQSLKELDDYSKISFDPEFIDKFKDQMNEFRMFRVEAAARRIRNQVSQKQSNI